MRDGNAQSCFLVCSDPAFYAALEVPLLVGNLGICKVSTITKAINLDTIMQSGEEERKRKTEKATKNRTKGKGKKGRSCGENLERMVDRYSKAVNGEDSGPYTSGVFMINESSLSVVSGSLDRQIAG